jgi:hypothetical protein
VSDSGSCLERVSTDERSLDGASKREFKSIIEEELPLIRGAACYPPYLAPLTFCVSPDACAKLGFNPTITLIIVGKEHKITLSTSEVSTDRESYPVNSVEDMTLRGVGPVELDSYLFGTLGLLGTSKATYYDVLIDENKFTYVLASCPRSAWVPTLMNSCAICVAPQPRRPSISLLCTLPRLRQLTLRFHPSPCLL